jgi:hypothetical protein
MADEAAEVASIDGAEEHDKRLSGLPATGGPDGERLIADRTERRIIVHLYSPFSKYALHNMYRAVPLMLGAFM